MTFVDERVDSDRSRRRPDSEGDGHSWRRLLHPIRAVRRRRHRIADQWLDREHRRRRRYILMIALAVCVVAIGVWVVWFSSLLAAQEVRIVGLSTEGEVTGSDQVTQAADITLGGPLALVDTAASADRVAQLPWIESVEVYRSWPNAIVVNVVERTPVAVVEEGETRRGVDSFGVLFDPPGGLWLTDPVIRGSESALPEAVAVVSSLPDEIERRVRMVQAVSPDDIRLQLGNDAIVRWGNAEEGDFKAQVLLALLPRRAQAYDVSAPQLPTTFGEKGRPD